MELIRKVMFFTCFTFITVSCKEKNNVNKKISRVKFNNCFVKEKLEITSRDVSESKDYRLEFFQNKKGNYLKIEDKKEEEGFLYALEDDFDLGEFHFWSYTLDNKKILLLELDDYYASIFYIYLFSNNSLFRIGDIPIHQPNVEELGIKEESFDICIENNVVSVQTFLGGRKEKFFTLKYAEKERIENEYESLKEWQGSYSFSFGRGDKDHTMAFEIYSQGEAEVEDYEGKKTKATIVRALKDTLELKGIENRQYIIYKEAGERGYAIKGAAVYLLNPPNNDYPLVKSKNF